MSRVGLRRFRAPGPACAGRAAKNARPGLAPGRCKGKAHDADHLGYAGRRVLVSRKWSGKTLADHRADLKDWLLKTLGVSATDPARYAWEHFWRDLQKRVRLGAWKSAGVRGGCHSVSRSVVAVF